MLVEPVIASERKYYSIFTECPCCGTLNEAGRLSLNTSCSLDEWWCIACDIYERMPVYVTVAVMP